MSDPTTDLLAEYDRFEREGGVAIVARDVVEVTGPEAGRYLQGQLSQEVVALPERALHVVADPPAGWQGRRLAAGAPGSSRSDYLLDVDAGFGDGTGRSVDAGSSCGPRPRSSRPPGGRASPCRWPEAHPVLGDSSVIGMVRAVAWWPGVAGHRRAGAR